ncbi:hypothetical protein GJ744_012098 [Endocarpon pusillum]|uniref:Uncharacterized protein n=1 Tax=Endocarpon pusillum TaxID=364733 RepID=A0A8H7AFJ7_9EURO|nr:hypothetical protein GJ744_012098 [Endocarpon pusillum]
MTTRRAAMMIMSFRPGSSSTQIEAPRKDSIASKADRSEFSPEVPETPPPAREEMRYKNGHINDGKKDHRRRTGPVGGVSTVDGDAALSPMTDSATSTADLSEDDPATIHTSKITMIKILGKRSGPSGVEYRSLPAIKLPILDEAAEIFPWAKYVQNLRKRRQALSLWRDQLELLLGGGNEQGPSCLYRGAP